MPHLTRLANSANSVLVKDMMIKLFEIDNERDFRVVSETYVTCQEFNVRCQERREQMIEMQPFLHVSTVLADSYNLLKELQDYELDKCRELMKSISETQLKVLKKISFIAKLRLVVKFAVLCWKTLVLAYLVYVVQGVLMVNL
ncbi:hypothetical protein Tco_0363531 [Tanacetum coccineum]